MPRNRHRRSRSFAAALLPVLLLAGGALAAVRPVADSARSKAPPPGSAYPPGFVPHRSALEGTPGWVPLVDPESTSVAFGRRLTAPAVRMPFRGGAPSLDALGREICRDLHHYATDSLMALCVSDSEFRIILWREFPQSRPATGVQWEDAWRILYARLHAGCSHASRDFGGHVYEFQRFESADTVQRFRNFRMHNRLTLVAKSDEGQIVRMTWLRSVVERGGRFKICSTDD